MASAAEKKRVANLLGQIAEQAAALPAPVLHEFLPALVEARETLQAEIARWMSNVKDPNARFTVIKYRETLLQLEQAMATLEKTTPDALRRALDGATPAIADKAISHLGQQVAVMAREIGGVAAAPTISVTRAAVIAQSAKARIHRHQTSTARYGKAMTRDIRQQLAVGVLKGETFSEMTSRIARLKGFVGRISGEMPSANQVAGGLTAKHRFWAERIVRTEVLDTYNQMELDALEILNEEDPGYSQRWDATNDRTCPICRKLDGEIVPIGGTFSYGYKRPPAHPLCRCALTAWRAEWGPGKVTSQPKAVAKALAATAPKPVKPVKLAPTKSAPKPAKPKPAKPKPPPTVMAAVKPTKGELIPPKPVAAPKPIVAPPKPGSAEHDDLFGGPVPKPPKKPIGTVTAHPEDGYNVASGDGVSSVWFPNLKKAEAYASEIAGKPIKISKEAISAASAEKAWTVARDPHFDKPGASDALNAKRLLPSELDKMQEEMENRGRRTPEWRKREAAIRHYVSDEGAADVNRLLRKGKLADVQDGDPHSAWRKHQAKEAVAGLDDIAAKTKTARPVTVYRGIDMGEWDPDFFTPGRRFIDDGYSSTTADPSIARAFSEPKDVPAFLTIEVPQGKGVVPIADAYGLKERELLMGRGTEYVVVSVTEERGSSGYVTNRNIHLRILK